MSINYPNPQQPNPATTFAANAGAVPIQVKNANILVVMGGSIGMLAMILFSLTIGLAIINFGKRPKNTMGHPISFGGKLNRGGGSSTTNNGTKLRIVWSMRNDERVTGSVHSSGDNFADYREMAKQHNFETRLPTDIPDALSLTTYRKKAAKNLFHRTYVCMWIGQQPVQEAYRSQVAELLTGCNPEPEILEAFKKWGTKEAAVEFLKYAVENHPKETVEIARLYPSDDMTKFIARQYLTWLRFDGMPYLREHSISDYSALQNIEKSQMVQGDRAKRQAQILAAWGVDVAKSKSEYLAKEGSLKDLNKMAFDAALQPQFSQRLNEINLDFSNHYQWFACAVKWGDKSLIPKVTRYWDNSMLQEDSVDFMEKFPDPRYIPYLTKLMNFSHLDQKAHVRAMNLLDKLVNRDSPIELRTAAILSVQKFIGPNGLPKNPSSPTQKKLAKFIANLDAEGDITFQVFLSSLDDERRRPLNWMKLRDMNLTPQQKQQLVSYMAKLKDFRRFAEQADSSTPELQEMHEAICSMHPSEVDTDVVIKLTQWMAQEEHVQEAAANLTKRLQRTDDPRSGSTFDWRAPELEPVMILLLEEDNPKVISFACEVLRVNGTKESLPALRTALENANETTKPMILKAGKEIQARIKRGK